VELERPQHNRKSKAEFVPRGRPEKKTPQPKEKRRAKTSTKEPTQGNVDWKLPFLRFDKDPDVLCDNLDDEDIPYKYGTRRGYYGIQVSGRNDLRELRELMTELGIVRGDGGIFRI
jgi:hypothetical protein